MLLRNSDSVTHNGASIQQGYENSVIFGL